MNIRKISRRLTFVLAGGMVAAITALPASAEAASSTYAYSAYVGGTRVNAVGMNVSSDLTAESAISGATIPASDSNSIAKVRVGSLLSTLVSTGAITTDTAASALGDGTQIVAHAKTAGVSLLGGAIKVDAIDTTATASGASDHAPHASVNTTVVGLTIAGKHYPLNLPANTGITIPGVASVIVNYQTTGANEDGSAAYGGGLLITLLKAKGQAAAGAEIVVNPIAVKTSRLANPKDGNPVGGYAYGSYVHANVGDAIDVQSERTAALGLPSYGTDGNTVTNSTASAHLSGVLNLGTITSTAEGVQTPALSEAKQTATVANVSLFSRLIHATAVGTTAHVQETAGQAPVLEGSLQFVNLWIAGKKIPLNVAPNTTIHVANLGTITLNKQETANVPGQGIGVRVTGIQIVLDTKRAGLPIGAVVELASSTAVIFGTN